MNWRVDHGDMMDLLPLIGEASFDACVTDPPYEIGFMGAAWDRSGVAFSIDTWSAVFRVLKPGAACLAFAAPRVDHRVALAIEDAGFVIEDKIVWFFTTGMPKTKTDLKPAYETIVVARKPPIKGARLFVERCMVPYRDEADAAKTKAKNPGRVDVVTSGVYGANRTQQKINSEGRRMPHMVVDEDVAVALGDASRILPVAKMRSFARQVRHNDGSL